MFVRIGLFVARFVLGRSRDVPGERKMAVSKNARREGEKVLTSRWGGQIKTKSVFENGRLHHLAYCTKSGNTARKPRDLM